MISPVWIAFIAYYVSDIRDICVAVVAGQNKKIDALVVNLGLPYTSDLELVSKLLPVEAQ